MSGFQPEEFKEAVRALWREGLTSGQIADAKGVTRNIVIGVLQRLGEDRRTQGRGATAKALPKPKLASVSRRVTHNPPSVTPTVSAEPRPISLPVLKATLTPDQRIEAPAPLLNKPVTAAPARPSYPVAESAPVTFFDLEKCMCRWPLAHAPDDEALYCGARCEFRASYCDAHSDVATQPKYRRPRGASGERLPIGRSVTASVSRSV